MLKSWSSTQRSITLSSGEAELVAAVKNLRGGYRDTTDDNGLGEDTKGNMFVDSSAAIGIAHRAGNGKLRHVKVGTLWIQEKVEEEELEIQKVAGEQHPAGLITQNLNEPKVVKFMSMIRQEYKEGRADSGLKVKEELKAVAGKGVEGPREAKRQKGNRMPSVGLSTGDSGPRLKERPAFWHRAH